MSKQREGAHLGPPPRQNKPRLAAHYSVSLETCKTLPFRPFRAPEQSGLPEAVHPGLGSGWVRADAPGQAGPFPRQPETGAPPLPRCTLFTVWLLTSQTRLRGTPHFRTFDNRIEKTDTQKPSGVNSGTAGSSRGGHGEMKQGGLTGKSRLCAASLPDLDSCRPAWWPCDLGHVRPSGSLCPPICGAGSPVSPST